MMATMEIDAASKPSEATADGQAVEAAPAYREVRYEHSRNFPAVLEHLGVSLLVSTYQAGKVFAVGARDGELALSFHNFEKAMGVAARPDRIAVGTRNQVWYLHAAPEPFCVSVSRLLHRDHGVGRCGRELVVLVVRDVGARDAGHE